MILQLLNKLPRPVKQFIVIIIDLLICTFTLWGSYSFRFEKLYLIQEHDLKIFLTSALLSFIIFYSFRLYDSVFRYSTYLIFKQLAKASFFYGLSFFLILIVFSWDNIPRSLGIIHSPLLFIFALSFRVFISNFFKDKSLLSNKNSLNVVVYGTDIVSIQLSELILSNNIYKICYFVDDSGYKENEKINTIGIISSNRLKEIYMKEKISEIFIPDTHMEVAQKKEIISNFEGIKIRVRFYSSIEDQTNEFSLEVFESLIFDSIKDRKNSNLNKNSQFLKNKIIFITGAGGSIGSQICRELIKSNPKKMILFDHSEYNLYQISQELNTFQILNNNKTEVISKIGSVQDRSRTFSTIKEFMPHLVYHTAAYKHVPIVEDNIIESIKNNVFGTKNIVDASLDNGVNKFVLVSTDKAVRSKNIMGKTKRLAELYVQAKARNCETTTLSIVRFGNVFGSSGSVAPLFYNQITNGGPVTITHPEVTRYLMSLPEAANLIILASSLSKGGEIFVLDMGDPIKIIDLAKKMISYLGKSIKDDENKLGDIELKIIGLRPGEKLHEELLIGDNYKKIENSKIIVAYEKYLNEDEINILITNLEKITLENNREEAYKYLTLMTKN